MVFRNFQDIQLSGLGLCMMENAFAWQMFMAGVFLNAAPGIILPVS